jgi:hydroxyacylglutathione hydrolase
MQRPLGVLVWQISSRHQPPVTLSAHVQPCRGKEDNMMLWRHIYYHDLAQVSYLVGDEASSAALIVDPNRDIDQYVAAAAREGLRIAAVAETHIHADVVSGARELAARTGAQLYLSGAGPAEWQYACAEDAGAIMLHDGDSFHVGSVRLDVLHTPGHTPEHVSLLVTDTTGEPAPLGVFTGDFLFVSDVGRPDLLEMAVGITGAQEQGARQLFQSLQRMGDLPEYLQIWPGHGAGSTCGRSLGGVPQSTLGYERRSNWAFGMTDADQFVKAVLDDQPAVPPSFAVVKRLNQQGPPLVLALPTPEQRAVEDLAAKHAAGMVVVDTRPADAFAGGHISGTINLPGGSPLLKWAGWVLPYDQPLGLIVDESTLGNTLRDLRLIGLDMVLSFWTPDVLSARVARGYLLASSSRVDAAKLQQVLEQGTVATLNVRSHGEYARGHIPGSRHLPLGELPRWLDDIPPDQPVVAYCQSGTRSMIAASILAAHGHTNVRDLRGGFGAWQTSGYAVAHGVRDDAAHDGESTSFRASEEDAGAHP